MIMPEVKNKDLRERGTAIIMHRDLLGQSFIVNGSWSRMSILI